MKKPRLVNGTNRWYVPQNTPETSELLGSACAALVVAGLAAKAPPKTRTLR